MMLWDGYGFVEWESRYWFTTNWLMRLVVNDEMLNGKVLDDGG